MAYVISEVRHLDYEDDEENVHRKMATSLNEAQRRMRRYVGAACRAAIKAGYVDDPKEVEFDLSCDDMASVEGTCWYTTCKIWEVE